jgi:hypothetical protein
MTFDQAQSPRLGQRTAVESTYVQIVDVTPGNDITDLVEAAWPGMLVFRNDLSQLQIYDPNEGGWRSISGAAGGQVSYVGTEEPTGTDFGVGDTWYDSDDNYQAYVWDGDSWELSTGPVGNKTYYETGYVLNPAFDPELPASEMNPYNLWIPLDPARVGVTAFTLGDIWYQTDDSNHPYRWGVNEGITEWVDIVNPAISQTGENTIAISELDDRVKEANYLALSANNTADTADGRVSMSDYIPGPDDVNYDQKQITYDPLTGVASEVVVSVPRENGSIWYMRTRPRLNMSTNPSLETDDVGWDVSGATKERHDHHTVPAGDWTLHITNSAVPEPHVVSYGASARMACQESLYYAASVYAELLTVMAEEDRPTVTLELVWHDAAGVEMTGEVSRGVPYVLFPDAFEAALMGTIAEPRVIVIDTAPVGAVSFYVREVCQDTAASVEWHTGAMLIEQEDDLGRYFDGDSYDGYWGANRDNPGVAHASVSGLIGDKLQEIYELRDGTWIQKFLTSSTIHDVAAQTITGQLGRDQLGTGVVSPDKHTAKLVKASEALLPGELVHVWNDGSGEHKVRRADALNRYEAHGFVWDGAEIGTEVAVYHTGYIEGRDNLAPGLQWLSPTPGQVTNQPPSSVGSIVQRVGFSPNPDVLDFQPGPAIRIT